MNGTPARYYDGRTSAALEVTVTVESGEDGQPSLFVAGGDLLREIPLSELAIETRVGAANRLIELPGGGTLELSDHTALDAALTGAGHRQASGWVGWLEGRWAVVLASLVVAVAAVWVSVQYGIPALARQAADRMPPDIGARIESESLEVADRDLFQPTALTAARQRKLRSEFDAMAQQLGLRQRTSLLFRDGGKLGANAFTLPGGTIVVTDQLVDLAEHDDELRAVFAHEFGHVRHRHTMRILLQNSATALLAVGFLGDVTAAGSLAASVPTMLAHAAYSRDFEREADAYARNWMHDNGIPDSRMNGILTRLEARYGGQSWGYLATHPPLAERLKN